MFPVLNRQTVVMMPAGRISAPSSRFRATASRSPARKASICLHGLRSPVTCSCTFGPIRSCVLRGSASRSMQATADPRSDVRKRRVLSRIGLSMAGYWPEVLQGGSDGAAVRHHSSGSARKRHPRRTLCKTYIRTSRFVHPDGRTADPCRNIRNWVSVSA